MIHPDCLVGVHGVMRHPKPCDGALVRCHLIPRRLLNREGFPEAVDDPRSYVLGCGGPVGIGGHHGALDQSRTLRLSRAVLPAGLEDLAAELGLGWWLDREYGLLGEEMVA